MAAGVVVVVEGAAVVESVVVAVVGAWRFRIR